MTGVLNHEHPSSQADNFERPDQANTTLKAMCGDDANTESAQGEGLKDLTDIATGASAAAVFPAQVPRSGSSMTEIATPS